LVIVSYLAVWRESALKEAKYRTNVVPLPAKFATVAITPDGQK